MFKYLMQSLSKLPVEKACRVEQVRFIRARKPPHLPRAKGKRFWVRPEPERNLEEEQLFKPIWNNYKAQLRSIYELYQAQVKFAGKQSQVAKQEREFEDKLEAKLLLENEEKNKALLNRQLMDEETRLVEEKLIKEHKLEELKDQEKYLASIAAKRVQVLKEKSKSFIDPNNLEYEIEKALNKVVSYNFSIKPDGTIQRDSLNQQSNAQKLNQ